MCGIFNWGSLWRIHQTPKIVGVLKLFRYCYDNATTIVFGAEIGILVLLARMVIQYFQAKLAGHPPCPSTLFATEGAIISSKWFAAMLRLNNDTTFENLHVSRGVGGVSRI